MSSRETVPNDHAEASGLQVPDHRAVGALARAMEALLRALAHELRGNLNTVMFSAANSIQLARTSGAESSPKIVEKQQRVTEVVGDLSAKIDTCTALFDGSDTDIKSHLERLASLLCKHPAVADIHVSMALPAKPGKTLEDHTSPVILALIWISNCMKEFEQVGSELASAVFYVAVLDLKGTYSLVLSRRDHSVDDWAHRSILSLDAATDKLLTGYTGSVAIHI